MKKNLIFTMVLGGMVAGLPTASNAELGFNLGVVSLYKDRGVDQDGRDEAVRPAVQGSVDYSFGNGLYVGAWGSSGRFGKADAEVDVYAGYGFQITEDLGLDLGYVHYIYPGEGSWNSGEAYIGLNYQRFSFTVLRGMKSDVNKGDMYYRLTYTHPLMEKLDFTVGVGYQHFHVADVRGKTDYSAGLSYAIRDNIHLTGTIAGANRRGDVDDGSRDTRFIVGLNVAF